MVAVVVVTVDVVELLDVVLVDEVVFVGHAHTLPLNVGRPALHVGGGVVLIPVGHGLGGYIPTTF